MMLFLVPFPSLLRLIRRIRDDEAGFELKLRASKVSLTVWEILFCLFCFFGFWFVGGVLLQA